jgi:hypothetical protein
MITYLEAVKTRVLDHSQQETKAWLFDCWVGQELVESSQRGEDPMALTLRNDL